MSETQVVTYHAKLVASCTDTMGYTNYVFENLDFQDYDDKYLMCVKFPNWNNAIFNYGDVGYVTVRFVREGIDRWYDGQDFNVYKYTNIIFLKFIKEKENFDSDNIIVD